MLGKLDTAFRPNPMHSSTVVIVTARPLCSTASRMESHGLPGVIQLTESCRTCLRQAWQLEPRDLVEIKGMGAMRTWTLRPPGSDGGGGDP